MPEPIVTPASIRRKLVVVGDGGCGKTSLLFAFTKDTFLDRYVPTVFENHVARVHIDGKPVDLALWDTAGQEDYDRLRPLSYPESNVVLICYAVDKRTSLENVAGKWQDEVRRYCGPGVPVILVACKTDLRGASDQVAYITEEEVNPVVFNLVYRVGKWRRGSGRGDTWSARQRRVTASGSCLRRRQGRPC